jgi:hypothetical protein
MAEAWAPCIECGFKRTNESNLPGLRTCASCGKVQIGERLDTTAAEAPTSTIPDGFSPAIPDYSEVMLGWRAWYIRPDLGGQPVTLQSCVVKSCFWPARTEVKALCNDSDQCQQYGSQKIPVAKHACGLYSAKSRSHLLTMSYPRYDPDSDLFTAIGQVKLWGKVIEASLGWRAEFGYPQMIEIPPQAHPYAADLEETYGVEVRITNIVK